MNFAPRKLSHFKDELTLLNHWLFYFGIVSVAIPAFLFIGVIINNFFLILIYIGLELLAFPTMTLFAIVYIAMNNSMLKYYFDTEDNWIEIGIVIGVSVITSELFLKWAFLRPPVRFYFSFYGAILTQTMMTMLKLG